MTYDSQKVFSNYSIVFFSSTRFISCLLQPSYYHSFSLSAISDWGIKVEGCKCVPYLHALDLLSYIDTFISWNQIEPMCTSRHPLAIASTWQVLSNSAECWVQYLNMYSSRCMFMGCAMPANEARVSTMGICGSTPSDKRVRVFVTDLASGELVGDINVKSLDTIATISERIQLGNKLRQKNGVTAVKIS